MKNPLSCFTNLSRDDENGSLWHPSPALVLDQHVRWGDVFCIDMSWLQRNEGNKRARFSPPQLSSSWRSE